MSASAAAVVDQGGTLSLPLRSAWKIARRPASACLSSSSFRRLSIAASLPRRPSSTPPSSFAMVSLLVGVAAGVFDEPTEERFEVQGLLDGEVFEQDLLAADQRGAGPGEMLTCLPAGQL